MCHLQVNVQLEKIGMRQSEVVNMKIGITGTIASGKTSVSILFRRMGFCVFNADQYAKMTTHASNPCFGELVAVLSEEVLDECGDIDRKKMADMIFHDEEKRKQVNAIVHPYVIEGMLRFFENHKDQKIIFAEIPLLFEANMKEYFDKILVVSCSKDTAIKRMQDDRDYSEEQALARYASQLDPEYQKENADDVILNDGDLKELGSKVNQYIATLRKEMRRSNGA